MTIKTLKWSLLVCSLFVAGLLPYPVCALQPNHSQFQLTIPAASLDLSDLDVRDEFNRPVRQEKALNQFRELFTRSLNQALLLGLTPLRRTLAGILAKTWDIFSAWFSKAVFRFETLIAYISSHARFSLQLRSMPHRFPITKSRSSNIGLDVMGQLTLKLISTTQLLR